MFQNHTKIVSAGGMNRADYVMCECKQIQVLSAMPHCIKLEGISEDMMFLPSLNQRCFGFSVAQRLKELLDLKNKKNSKSRKKRKQNTEDEGKKNWSMIRAEKEDT